MAGGGGERRMVFDIRGKRKHVVKFVYAILAILMGSSLFLVVGPVNIGSLLGTSSSSSSAGAIFEEQAANIERKLKQNPNDEELLGALFRSRVNAGNATVVVNPQTQQQEVPAESLVQFRKASEVWAEYLKQAGKEPNPTLALLAANSSFSMAIAATTASGALASIKEAAAAQQIVAKAKPDVGSLSTLAIYQYFAFQFAAGDKTEKQAQALTTSKAEAKSLSKQLAEYRKRGKKFQKSAKKFAKTEKSAGKEALEGPLGSLSGGGSTLAP
jgi:hypothetical protein